MSLTVGDSGGQRSVAAHSGRADPLRVAFVLEGLALGGCPINAIDLARTLRSRGHEVHLLAIDEQVLVSILPYAEVAGFEVTLLPTKAGLLARARQLRRYAEAHDLRVIHVFAPWLGRAAALASGLRRRRIAVVLNWMMTNEFPTTSRTPLLVGTVGLHEEALREHGSRAWLLEPPVDLAHDRPDAAAGAAFRAEYSITPTEVLLTVITRVDRVMKLSGILMAMDAVAVRDDPDLRLAVVGDGNAMEQVRLHAAKVNAELGREAIILTGALADPHPAYAATDVGLAMGGSASRTLAHGRALVVLGENGFSRLFEPASNDYFMSAGFFGTDEQPEPAQHLAAQLGRLDPGTRESLGRWGLGVAEERFGLDAAATRLEVIYRDCLVGASPAPVRLLDDAYLVSRHGLGVLRRAAAGPRRARS
ncbi:glycosyltransferase [Nocardioides sp. InS609-2]|uniref:glycosyltransferase n=1 Tax=Nocardioides sp. InS609-2 TaxID=2760705 RepID=UPI0020C14262|nr:glycosyltransferase [Nocardioides sp. InS609-2]